MNVNSIPYQHSNYWYSNATNLKTESAENGLFSISGTVVDTQDLNLLESESTNILEDIKSKYDVRKATFDEIKEISLALYEAGEISGIEHAILTFDFERATNYLKQNAPVSIPSSFDMYETLSNSSGERDWIAEFEARAEKDFKYGNLIGFSTKKKIVNILQLLEK